MFEGPAIEEDLGFLFRVSLEMNLLKSLQSPLRFENDAVMRLDVNLYQSVAGNAGFVIHGKGNP
jgi:hypothetical protein